MTSKKTTRRALFSSFMALLLCCSMLVGTTFAWFTDSVTSSGNIIKSGTLDVKMYYSDKVDDIGNDASTGAIFDYKFWEPGFTQTKYVKVMNVGDLAFQYRLHVIPNAQPAAGEANLADVIDVYAAKVDATYAGRADAMDAANKIGTLADLIANAEGTAYGYLLPTEGADPIQGPADADTGEAVWCITLHMQESAGNEYQDLTVGEDGLAGLNGDLLVWYDVLDRAVELSSMGIRVDREALLHQLKKSGKEERKELYFHRRMLNDELPLSIGGGIGQSRLCMLLLKKAHIGEIQSSIWPEEMRSRCKEMNIPII